MLGVHQLRRLVRRFDLPAQRHLAPLQPCDVGEPLANSAGFFNNRVTSRGRSVLFLSKWIANADVSNRLAVAQIFSPQNVASQFRGGVDYHRVPETQLRLFVKRDGGQNIIGSGREQLPGRELANAVGGFVKGEGFGDLYRHCDEELLQDLHTEAAEASLPQVREQSFGRGLFLASGSVEGVDEDVRVNELARLLSAHEARRGSTCAGRECQAIGRISSQRALASSQLNIADPRQPSGRARPS